jgi:hypothetical protein
MVIDNVSSDVNGTRVECSSGDGVVSTDITNVIGNGEYKLDTTIARVLQFLGIVCVQLHVCGTG